MTDAMLSSMKPRLRHTIAWVPTDDGEICFITSRGHFTLRGANIQPWIDRLAPFLDGQHTVEQLTKSLKPEQCEKVESIIGWLHQRCIVEDLGRDEPHTLNKDEESAYASQIGYVAEYVEAAGQRFQRYRESRTLVIGSGLSLVALLEAVLRNGSRRVRVAISNESDTDWTRVLEAIDSARRRDPAQCCNVQALGWGAMAYDDRQTELASLIMGSDVVFHVSDRPMLARAQDLDQLCAEYGKVLCQAVVVGEDAWVGPVSTPGAPSSHWEAAWRRLQCRTSPNRGSQQSLAFLDQVVANSDPPLNLSTAVLVANTLVLQSFTHMTGADTGGGCRITRIDLSVLSSTFHTFMPHPLALPTVCATAAEFRRRVGDLKAGLEMDEQSFSRAAATCVDERLGIVTEIGERHFQQLPLWVTEARVSDPVGLLAARGVSGTVYGAALDFTTSRHRAARRALELYASAMQDRRRLLTVAATPLTDLEDAEHEGWLWSWRLDDSGERLVRASAVFATSKSSTSNDDEPQIPAGVASGRTWEEAVATGLLRRCGAIAVADAFTSPSPFPFVDLDQVKLDDDGRRLLHILRIAGARVVAYDLTGDLGIPTFTLYFGERPIVHAAGWTAANALRDGLEQVLLAYQAEAAGQPEYTPPAVAGLPAYLRGDHVIPIREPLSGLHRADWIARAAEALKLRGGTPVVVPLDHDPALAAVLPYAVRVVVAD